MGMSHLAKAKEFRREQNWSQALRYSDLAATKLKQLKDRPIEALSEALSHKCNALGFLGQYREQLECAKEWYCLWNTKPTDVGAIDAAFALIESCMNNKEFADAHLYASTLFEIINHKHDNKIPDNQRQQYIAKGAYFLAQATLYLAQSGGIPPEEKQKAAEEAIALARRALEIHTQLRGTEHSEVAADMVSLAGILGFFNNEDDDEILRLIEQAKAIFSRVQGNSSVNVATCESNVGGSYYNRAMSAHIAHDLDRELANLELALPHFHEAARIYRAVNRVECADKASQKAVEVEQMLRQVSI